MVMSLPLYCVKAQLFLPWQVCRGPSTQPKTFSGLDAAVHGNNSQERRYDTARSDTDSRQSRVD